MLDGSTTQSSAYPVGSLEDFCLDCGYNPDSRTAEGIYNNVIKEYTNLERLYSEAELEKMREIQ